MLYLVAVCSIHLYLCRIEVCRSKIQHAAVIRQLETYCHVILYRIHQVWVGRNIVAIGIYITDDQEIVVIIDMLGIFCSSSQRPCAFLDERS